MLTALWGFVFGSPLRVVVWLGNRLATWTSLVWVWRGLRHRADRPRRFVVWMVVLNVVSYGALFAWLWWLTHR